MSEIKEHKGFKQILGDIGFACGASHLFLFKSSLENQILQWEEWHRPDCMSISIDETGARLLDILRSISPDEGLNVSLRDENNDNTEKYGDVKSWMRTHRILQLMMFPVHAFEVFKGGLMMLTVYRREIWDVTEEKVIRETADNIGRWLERDILQQDKLRLQKILYRSQKLESIGRLAGGISHEFNNILLIVQGHLDLLIEEEHEGLKETLQTIREASDRAVALTRRILAFSKNQTLTLEKLNVNDVIEGLLPVLRRSAAPNVHIHAELSQDIPPVFADNTALEQVFVNLVMNANEAMDGPGSITITTQPASNYAAISSSGDPFVVEITVNDDGSGMTEETQSRIFDPFFSTKDNPKSAGLGLSAVHGIIGQLHGHIEVNSSPGRGTRFRILLPENINRIDTASNETVPAGFGSHKAILVIGRDRNICEFLSLMLETYGFTIETVNKLSDYTIHPSKKLFEVVVVDFSRDYHDDGSSRDYIEEIAANTPVIVTSTGDLRSIREELLDIPGVFYTEEPFTLSRFLKTVHDVISCEPDRHF